MANRKIVAGALSIADGFNVAGIACNVMIRLSTPDGDEFEIPMDIKIYEDIEEYAKAAETFKDEVKRKQQP